jgi:hypothetical protein
MKHLTALGIKFLFHATVILSIIPIFEAATLTNLIWISLLVTGLSYVIGDLLILPRFGNAIATIADFALISVAVWGLTVMFVGVSSWGAALSSSLAISFAEILFHGYMAERVFEPDSKEGKVIPFPMNERMQTEFAKENEPYDEDKDKNE